MITKNAVILIGQIDAERAAGKTVWDAVVEASSSRFRPIMLTAVSTVLGMIPIAPTVFWGPMAFAIMGGLLVGTAADAGLPAGALRRLVRSQGADGRDPDGRPPHERPGSGLEGCWPGRPRLVKWAALLIGVVALTLLGRGLELAARPRRSSPGIRSCPRSCMPRNSIRRIGLQYLKAEQTIFDEVRARGDGKAAAEDACRSTAISRAARSIPGISPQDWNRSYIMEPDGPPLGAVVLLHGLTDSPYSLRHIAERYRDHGLRRGRDPHAWPRHGARGPDRHRLGGLDGGDAARRARGPPARRPVAAAASRRASPTAARWRCSTRSTRSRTRSLPGRTAWC